jgi:hypothetical protein
MTLQEKIQYQINDGSPLSEDMINSLGTKFYTSGDKIKIGDRILYGVMKVKEFEDSFIIISFNEEEIGVIYHEDTSINRDDIKLPILLKINSDN